MLLAVDIGNTDVTIGVFDGETLRATWRLASIRRTVDEVAVLLFGLIQHAGLNQSDVTDVSLCSVVPPLVPTYEEMFKRYFNVTPLVVGAGTKTGVRIRIDNPREAGADRIVNSAAAHHLYQGAAIIVDMGTATTFDAVSAEGDYLGGAISPGLIISSEALFLRTSKLPRIDIVQPKKAIGANTVDAMQSGIVFGYIGLVEGIVARIQKEMGQKAKVIATGGYATLLAKMTSVFDEVNLDLTLVGLRLIYQMNKA